jgi:UDP-N-acetylmuramate dehydrogenase
MKIYNNQSLENSLNIKSVSKFFIEINNQDDFNDLYDFIKKENLPVLVIGEGTNIVLPDKFDGITVKPIFDEINIDNNNNTISVGASVNWHKLVLTMIEKNIYGFENLSLIPGSVGAAPIQNIGAYGQEISNLIHEVHCFDYISGNFTKYTNKECKFSYRDSFLKNNNMIIYKVIFKSDNPKLLNLEYQSVQNHINDNDVNVSKLDLHEVSNVICTIRNKNLPDPTNIPNAGSFFKNAIVIKDDIKIDIFGLKDLIIWDIDNKYSKVGSARLIELIKDKLEPNKNVGLHKRHSLVLVTNSNASQDDVLNYAHQVKDVVFETFNIMLEIEPKIIIN